MKKIALFSCLVSFFVFSAPQIVSAATGVSLGVLTADQFSIVVIAIILTTFLAPFAIKKLAEEKPSDPLPQSRSRNLFKNILSRKHYSASNQAVK